MEKSRNLTDWFVVSLDRLSLSAAVCSLAAVVFGELGRRHWILDLFSHFQMQYLCILVAAIVWRLVRKLRKGLGFFFAGVFWIVFRIAPLWLDTQLVTAETPNVRLMTVNVFVGNDNYERVRSAIREAEPDVVVLQEVTPAWKQQLAELTEEFPHFRFSPRNDSFGIAILSRLPLKSIELPLIGEVPWIEATVEVNETKNVRLLAAHTLPPGSAAYSATRNDQLRSIDETVRRAKMTETPLVVAGDLNCTPWSGHLRDLLERNKLGSARRGFGWNASWPTGRPVLLIPIDHVLVGEGVSVHQFSVLNSVGSDHYPVIADLVVGSMPEE